MGEDLDLRKKIGQLMVLGFAGTTVTEEIKALIRDDHVGGIILFARNIGTPEDVLRLTTELQLVAKHAGHDQPLFICTDQENGVVRRLGEGTTFFPGAMVLGATRNAQYAFDVGLATGKELKALGINWNLAPTIDVNNNPLNPVIGVRSYGEDPIDVAEFGKAALRGMQQAGVITTLKHFPGHGDTNLDSHLELPTITHDLDRLQEVELKPFAECIQAGADVVMSAHVYFPAIEKRKGVPATLSQDVITGLLRNTLQFQGVVTTDSMEMKAISHTIGTARGAVEALNAGVDLIMVSHTHPLQKETIEEIVAAVQSEEIDQHTIDQAWQRVQQLKKKYLTWTDIHEDITTITAPSVVGCAAHRELAEHVYRQGITIVQNNKTQKDILPLSRHADHRVLVVYPQNTAIMQVEDKRYSGYALGPVIQEILPSAAEYVFSNPPSDAEIEEMVKKSEAFDTLIVGSLTAAQSPEQQKLIEQLAQTGKPIIVLAMRSPYDLAYISNVSAYIATYEFTTTALRIAARSIFGLDTVHGTLPVTLPEQE